MDFDFKRKIDRIYTNVWLGSQSDAANLQVLQENHITHILVCGKEQKFYFPDKFEYLKLDIYNFEWGADLSQLFDQAVDFIRRGNCLVHCAAGMHRAPTFVLAYLIRTENMTVDQAYKITKERRPRIDPPDRFLQQLEDYYNKVNPNKIACTSLPQQGKVLQEEEQK